MGLNIKDYLEIIYYRIKRLIKDFIRNTKYFFQKQIRGYSDLEVYGLHWHATAYILPRLKAMRGNLHGHPSKLTEEEWNDILNEIIWSLQRHLDYNDLIDGLPKMYSEEHKLEGIRMQKGFELMGKYWADLWD